MLGLLCIKLQIVLFHFNFLNSKLLFDIVLDNLFLIHNLWYKLEANYLTIWMINDSLLWWIEIFIFLSVEKFVEWLKSLSLPQ